MVTPPTAPSIMGAKIATTTTVMAAFAAAAAVVAAAPTIMVISNRVAPPPSSIKLDVPEDKTIIVGITGEPGAGKSALSQEFAKLGATIIDVDSAGHDVIELPSVKRN